MDLDTDKKTVLYELEMWRTKILQLPRSGSQLERE